jgi:GNAT superfamily N-acetyltransferase
MSGTLTVTRPPAPVWSDTVRPEAGLVREARPGDADAVCQFICDLSSHSRYLRFFASVAPPSSALLAALCGSTGADILVVTDPGGRMIAHGMAADDPVPGTSVASKAGAASNIGLVVADQWQERGLGTLLLSALVARAARRGVQSLVLDILPDNHRMLGIIARRWPEAARERTSDAIVIRPVITPAQAAGGGPVPAGLSLCGQKFCYLPGGGRAACQPAA